MLIKNWDDNGKFDPCSLYNYRLDWLESQIKIHRKNKIDIPEPQYERWFGEEHKVYENNLKSREVVDRIESNTAVIVPTHTYHSVWLKACLESCKKLGFFILVAYDNPFFDESHQTGARLPSVHTFMLADLFLMKHKTYGGGVGHPHSWNMWYGMKMLKSMGFEYVFNLNGDCILEKPEGFQTIREMLGDNDIISCDWFPHQKHLGTMSYLGKMDVILHMWEKNLEHLYHFNIGNAEARFGKWMLEEGFKIVPVENPDEAHFKPPGSQNATWRKVLGLRHLHAEHKIRRTMKLEPIEEKYFDRSNNDQYLSGYERNTLVKYWETGDKKYLEAWWGV